jgi:hypothetical protein
LVYVEVVVKKVKIYSLSPYLDEQEQCSSWTIRLLGFPSCVFNYFGAYWEMDENEFIWFDIKHRKYNEN